MAIPITPDSTVYLLKCPLESDNLHQLTFANATAQFNYFNSLPKLEFDNVSYQRKDGVIRINAHIDDIINYNYVMYQNSNYSDEWYFAFITNMEYANDNVTFVTIKTDVWQTWQHHLSFRKCFVEREHVNDDTIGLHTVPEGLETGDYICNDVQECMVAHASTSTATDGIVVMFQVTTASLYNGNTAPTSAYETYGGIPQGCSVFGIELTQDTATIPSLIVQEYDKSNQADAIVSIFLVPKLSMNWTSQHGTGETFSNFTFLVPQDSWTTSIINNKSITVTKHHTFDDYVPKNNKMYTSPYCYFHISNLAGADVSYAYENFIGDPYFRVISTFGVGGSVKLEPNNSKLSDRTANYDAFDEGLTGMKLPTLSWSSNFYLNWVAQNGKNIEIRTALNTVSAVAGSWFNTASSMGAELSGESKATGGMSAVADLANYVLDTMQTIKEAQMTPPQVKGNTNSADIGFSQKGCSFVCYQMSVRREFAEQIDNFFSLYGYKVNMTKVPNIYGRENWNYLKLVDANIIGDIPSEDMNEIKSLFHRGITLWHNPNTFLDYTQNNNIV